MSARIYDLQAARKVLSAGLSFDLAVRAAENAGQDAGQRERARLSSAKRSAAAIKSHAAREGKPRCCRFCRSSNHYANTCPIGREVPEIELTPDQADAIAHRIAEAIERRGGVS